MVWRGYMNDPRKIVGPARFARNNNLFTCLLKGVQACSNENFWRIKRSLDKPIRERESSGSDGPILAPHRWHFPGERPALLHHCGVSVHQKTTVVFLVVLIVFRIQNVACLMPGHSESKPQGCVEDDCISPNLRLPSRGYPSWQRFQFWLWQLRPSC